MLEKDRVKPDGSTMDYEKNLSKVATRGGMARRQPTKYYFSNNLILLILQLTIKLPNKIKFVQN